MYQYLTSQGSKPATPMESPSGHGDTTSHRWHVENVGHREVASPALAVQLGGRGPRTRAGHVPAPGAPSRRPLPSPPPGAPGRFAPSRLRLQTAPRFPPRAPHPPAGPSLPWRPCWGTTRTSSFSETKTSSWTLLPVRTTWPGTEGPRRRGLGPALLPGTPASAPRTPRALAGLPRRGHRARLPGGRPGTGRQIPPRGRAPDTQ